MGEVDRAEGGAVGGDEVEAAIVVHMEDEVSGEVQEVDAARVAGTHGEVGAGDATEDCFVVEAAG